MKNNNYMAGVMLIFLGLAFFLKNYNISVISSLLIMGGLYFFYSYFTQKHQPHLLFGVILTATGVFVLLKDWGKLNFNISGELFLILLGVFFLFVYFRKGLLGFVFPGYILPCIGVYLMIMDNMNWDYMWPSFLILLGIAFYLIYFTAFIQKSSWPLIPGTILIALGLAGFAFSLEILTWNMVAVLLNYQNYILSAAIILIGIGLLIKGLRR
jgi:hypothetical protein